MFRFVSWLKAVWKERCEEVRTRAWAREMAKKAGKTE